MIDTQALRNKILDLAMRGKLVEQRPEEGTGEELYQKILAEKARLVKEGKIKKQKPLPEITDEEKPFEIPESWKWVRWGDISKSIQYGYNTPALSSGTVQMVRISDIQDGKINWSTVPYCEISDEDIALYRLKRNDILFARTGGTVGKSFLVSEMPNNAIYAGYLIRTQYSDLLCPEFLLSFMRSRLYWMQLHEGTTATAQPNCNGVTLSKMLLPLPPLDEQKRIARKLDVILDLLIELDSCQSEYKINGEKLKSKLMSLAVEGKLVEQRTEDGTGEELYKQIQKEKEKLIKEGKIKKQKPLPEITEDEKPFETPQSWKWVYLGDVFDHNTGKALNGSDDNGVSLTYITTSNLYWDHFELDHLKTMPFTDDEITKCTVHQGDLLVCEGGDIGRSAIWNFDYDMRIQNHIHRLRPYVNIDVRYFYYVMMYLKNNGSIRGRGIGLQGLSSKALHVIRVPLPPLAEQKRIVAKIEELLPLCDQLK